jgi:hypothetical protein
MKMIRMDVSPEAFEARALLLKQLDATAATLSRKALARRADNLYERVAASLHEMNAALIAGGLAPWPQQQRVFSLSLGRMV